MEYIKDHWKSILIVTFAFTLGVFFRLYNISFGLPHCFHADEPEIAELAVKYTYEFRDIIQNNNYYKLIPISYVYGTFPTYLFTVMVMAFSKGANMLNLSFDKTDIYVFLRSFNAILSMLIPIFTGLLTLKIFKTKKGAFIAFFLTTMSWKLIVHAHYINADIILTIILTVANYFAFRYYKEEDSLYVWLMGLLLGIAIGTKITAFLNVPFFLLLLAIKKDFRSFFAFVFLVFIGFAISNPFSLIFAQDFAFRIYSMTVKEAGLVFDSVNFSWSKYIESLTFIMTPLIFAISLYGTLDIGRRHKREKFFHVFLLGQVAIYLLFYSLNSRQVDRWLLPILPIMFIYAARGIIQLLKEKRPLLKTAVTIVCIVAISHYMYFPYLLLRQYQKHTPKSAAYIWMKENVSTSANKLTITEEGLDPLNKLQGILVKRFNVYESENAQFEYPENPLGYDYVILASKPMKNYKKREVIEKFPTYARAWQDFENTITNGKNFTLIKEFTLPKPNLVNLSEVYIYENNDYR